LEAPLNDRSASNDCLGPRFGLINPPRLSTRPVKDAWFSLTRLQCQIEAGQSRLVELPPQDAYFLMVYLRDTNHCDRLANGEETDIRCYRQGSICLVDLAEGAAIRLCSDLDSLALQLPRALFAEVGQFPKAPKTRRLGCRRGEPDDTMRSLSGALLQLLSDTDAVEEEVLQHIAIAICAHLLHHYGDDEAIAANPSSALSARQEQAAKEFMMDHFSEDLSAAAIAASAGLPSRVFALGFKSATSQTPLQWLTDYRVRRAKQYLADQGIALDLVASLCGFNDRHRFARVFRRETGVRPEDWRRQWRH